MICVSEQILLGLRPRTGRTGRFGRKGVSINFVHNKKTWEDMHMIEEALGRDCIRVETNDIDVMEEVRCNRRSCFIGSIMLIITTCRH